MVGREDDAGREDEARRVAGNRRLKTLLRRQAALSVITLVSGLASLVVFFVGMLGSESFWIPLGVSALIAAVSVAALLRTRREVEDCTYVYEEERRLRSKSQGTPELRADTEPVEKASSNGKPEVRKPQARAPVSHPRKDIAKRKRRNRSTGPTAPPPAAAPTPTAAPAPEPVPAPEPEGSGEVKGIFRSLSEPRNEVHPQTTLSVFVAVETADRAAEEQLIGAVDRLVKTLGFRLINASNEQS